MDDLQRKFDQIAATCTFLSRSGQISAHKLTKSHNVTLETLAMMKYILPDDIIFEYQETPFNVHRKDIPQKLLVFEFLKQLKSSKASDVIRLVNQRRELFAAALQQFCSRRDFGELEKLAIQYMPDTPPVVETLDLPLKVVLDDLESLALTTKTIPSRTAKFAEDIPDSIKEVLKRKGITSLYAHQYTAIDLLLQGFNIVVSTSTASGKTLIFQAPIVSALEQDKDATCLFIYPTKALAQDQLRVLSSLSDDIICGTFDGDTPPEARDYLSKHGRALFTNPDIIHYTILPNWSAWQGFLENLRFVVIDELHSYKGLFGAHVSMILRRLRRICHQLGNDSLQFICCSATIHRPLDFTAEVTGLKPESIRLIDSDGSPASSRRYFFLQAPELTPGDKSGERAHPMVCAAPLFLKMVACGLRVIAFCHLRRTCELLMRAIRQNAEQMGDPGIMDSIMSYRGGYSIEDRRRIERDMFAGRLKGIVATSALELGIDIGSLDAVLLCGFPTSLSSLRQQVGRVGRRNHESYVVYIAGGGIMDQTYINNPDRVFNDNDPDIPLALVPSVVESHAQCAACELAISEEESEYFSSKDSPWALVRQKLELADGLYHCSESWLPHPTQSVNIRRIEQQNTLVIDITDDRNVMLETIEFSRVGFTVYPGAVYIHQGKPYLVVDLEENLAYAKVVRTKVKWTTRQRDYTDIDPQRATESSKWINDYECAYGLVKLTTVVFGYFKMDTRNRIIEAHDLVLPPYSTTNAGMWINIPISTLKSLQEKKLHIGASIHGAEHAILNILGRFVAVAPSDVGTECKAPEKELAKTASSRKRPARLIFYERNGPEGTGIWDRAFAQLVPLTEEACSQIDNCPCHHGCHSCVAWSICTEKNVVVSKWGALLILRRMLGKPVEDIPDGPEAHLMEEPLTVVPVSGEIQ